MNNLYKKENVTVNINQDLGTASSQSFQLPWDRFWARWIDIIIHLLISFLVFLFLVYEPSGPTFLQQHNDLLLKKYIITMVMVFVTFIIYETFFLCVFAATPGKALFGIRVFGRDGKKLSVRAAVIRAVSFYCFGLYFNLLPSFGPPVAFWLSSYYYNKNGIFRWDKFSHSSMSETIIQ